MIKSVICVAHKLLRRNLIKHQSAFFYSTHNEVKSKPRVISDAVSVDELQYFSLKMKDLMDTEQLEYFENVIRKVENINHPVADLMKVKLHNPMLDLIMLLVTKMVNQGKEISPKQKSLSNAIQLIHIGNLVHQKGMFDLSKVPNYGNNLAADDDLIMGNKIALLAGDFLLANAQIRITKMRDAEVLRIISRAMCDVIDSNFVGIRNENNDPLPYEPGSIPDAVDISFEESSKPVKLVGTSGTSEDEWMLRQALHRGFLIAKGCQATAVLDKQPQGVQRNCFELGKNAFLAWQAFDELKSFKDEILNENTKVNLISAPVLFHLKHEPALYRTIIDESESSEGVDHPKLFSRILNGRGMSETETLLKKLKSQAFKELSNFSPSDDKTEFGTILEEL